MMDLDFDIDAELAALEEEFSVLPSHPPEVVQEQKKLENVSLDEVVKEVDVTNTSVNNEDSKDSLNKLDSKEATPAPRRSVLLPKTTNTSKGPVFRPVKRPVAKPVVELIDTNNTQVLSTKKATNTGPTGFSVALPGVIGGTATQSTPKTEVIITRSSQPIGPNISAFNTSQSSILPSTSSITDTSVDSSVSNEILEEERKKRTIRHLGNKTWVDETLADWPENDYRIFVGNLNGDVSEQQLLEAFSSSYPSAQKAKVVKDEVKQKNYGFVSFSDPLQMARSIREMDNQLLNGRPMNIKSTLKGNHNTKKRRVR